MDFAVSNWMYAGVCNARLEVAEMKRSCMESERNITSEIENDAQDVNTTCAQQINNEKKISPSLSFL